MSSRSLFLFFFALFFFLVFCFVPPPLFFSLRVSVNKREVNYTTKAASSLDFGQKLVHFLQYFFFFLFSSLIFSFRLPGYCKKRRVRGKTTKREKKKKKKKREGKPRQDLSRKRTYLQAQRVLFYFLRA
eukprot:TRINITY_DN11874_c1_g1_i1.p1 TRINITY_DN11874_c1_g1~~TRINITY_DN11874_c1_g1_i1.p1  ORF type:complete len:129 (+),score=1.17 TRINITY_DN11874_c1_g1_i1:92-478(+)